MTVNMPPRQSGLEGIPLDDPGLTIGKIPMPGVGLRVGMQCDGRLMILSPAKARRMAKGFDRKEAIENDLGWVAVALRETADEIDATPHEEQMRYVQQGMMMRGHSGPRQ